MNFNDLSPFHFAKIGIKGLKELSTGLEKLVRGKLWLKILIALFLGLATGLLLGPEAQLVNIETAASLTGWFAIPGELFLAMIKLVVIPLVFASVVLGIVGGESIQKLKSLGLKVLFFYIITTIIAAIIGLVTAQLIRPGQYIDSNALNSLNASTAVDITQSLNSSKKIALTDIVQTLVPANPFDVLVSGEMLQIVLLAIFLGIALMSLESSEARPLLSLLNTFQKISMVVISWAMRLAPIAVFGLTTKVISKLGLNALLGLGVYVGAVILGLGVLFVFYLALVRQLAKTKIFSFIADIKEVLLLAFSTSSSASVMPLTIQTAEKKLAIDPSVSQFVIPLGTTINMAGTALYQTLACAFLAQAYQVDLSLAQMMLVILSATISSIGAPGTPGVGIAVLASILTSVGIPATGVMLIIGVDRLLDMCRTVLNVLGDISAALIMNHFNNKNSGV